jgi:hypothetical protein
MVAYKVVNSEIEMYHKSTMWQQEINQQSNLYFKIKILAIRYAPMTMVNMTIAMENNHKWHLSLATFLWLLAYMMGKFGLGII